MHINAKSQRALLWVFLIGANIYTLAFWKLMGFFPPVPANLSDAEIVPLYADHNIQFLIGAVIMMASAGFQIPLIIVVAAQMARLEKGYALWSKMQLVAGTLGTWLFAFPPFLWGVTAFTVERDPALTQMLHEMAWLCFVTPPTYFALQVFPMAIVAMSKDNNDPLSAFPRWFGYLTFWEGIAGIFGMMGMLFKVGPFAWNGWFAFYLPVVTFAIWLACLLPLLFRGIRLQEAAAKG